MADYKRFGLEVCFAIDTLVLMGATQPVFCDDEESHKSITENTILCNMDGDLYFTLSALVNIVDSYKSTYMAKLDKSTIPVTGKGIIKGLSEVNVINKNETFKQHFSDFGYYYLKIDPEKIRDVARKYFGFPFTYGYENNNQFSYGMPYPTNNYQYSYNTFPSNYNMNYSNSVNNSIANNDADNDVLKYDKTVAQNVYRIINACIANDKRVCKSINEVDLYNKDKAILYDDNFYYVDLIELENMCAEYLDQSYYNLTPTTIAICLANADYVYVTYDGNNKRHILTNIKECYGCFIKFYKKSIDNNIDTYKIMHDKAKKND